MISQPSMNKLTLTVGAFIAAVFFALACSAPAHTVWIEPLEDKLVARFAEPGNDFETSPGHLDSLTAPVAFRVITNAPLTIQSPKKADHFLLAGAGRADAVCLESIFTVRGGRKPHFYARWDSIDRTTDAASRINAPLLTLDIVPTGKSGEARAWFRGQPLAGVKATLRTPDGKEEELTADSEGFIRFKTKQAGQHLLTIAHHREPIAGFHAGRAYQQTSHNAALTWLQP
jgi:hypothetical protein